MFDFFKKKNEPKYPKGEETSQVPENVIMGKYTTSFDKHEEKERKAREKHFKDRRMTGHIVAPFYGDVDEEELKNEIKKRHEEKSSEGKIQKEDEETVIFGFAPLHFGYLNKGADELAINYPPQCKKIDKEGQGITEDKAILFDSFVKDKFGDELTGHNEEKERLMQLDKIVKTKKAEDGVLAEFENFFEELQGEMKSRQKDINNPDNKV